MIAYHVLLVDRTHERPTLDLTPDAETSYLDARQTLIEFAALFPVLHEPGSRSYLEICAVGVVR